MAKADAKKYKDNLALYEKLVATNPKVERKGATMPYTSVNGHMFSLLTKQGYLILRLPEKQREAFMEKHKTGPVMQYGAVMKEYVEVPPALLEKTKELQKVFAASYAYVSSLKPKPTKKPAKKKD